MGIAYCAIKWEFAGKAYETVHTLHSGSSTAPGQNTFTALDLTAWGFDLLGVAGLDERTDPSGIATFNPSSLIEFIIGFHRRMQGQQVRLTQVYINDGFTLGVQTGNFATFDLDLTCESPLTGTTLSNYAPANQALMLDKASAGFSQRGGRMWLRGAMQASYTIPAAEDGVTLTESGRVSLSQQLSDYLVQEASGGENNSLSKYFGTGTAGADGTTPVQYCIGRTVAATVDGKVRRVLNNWTPVANISVDDAQSRDTRRRNKKAVGTP